MYGSDLTPTCHVSILHPQYSSGINSLDLVKKKNSPKGNKVVRDAISALRDAAACSDWNFTNKLRLLEAEQQSQRQNHRKSVDLYIASIEAAKNSGFIHEQGLACEKAALYFMKVKEEEKALQYFQQARECYEEWGSDVKVDYVQKKMDSLSKGTSSSASFL
jgi:hypothetical protein